jgi:hypothetical protein
MGLTSKAETEGTRLAQVSGGVYYPIRRLDELQKAYNDIVVQLRTAYTVTFRSDSRTETSEENRASPRLRVKVARDHAFVNIGRVIDLPDAQAENLESAKRVISAKRKVHSAKFENRSFTLGVSRVSPSQPLRFSPFLRTVKLGYPAAGFSAENLSVRQVPEITGQIHEVKYKPRLANAASDAFLTRRILAQPIGHCTGKTADCIKVSITCDSPKL